MRIGFFIGIPWLDASAVIRQNASTLDLIFDQNAYYVYDSGPLVSKSFSDIITFSRGSNATYFDSAGVLKYAPNNLFTHSEEFNDSDWTKTNSSVSPDVVIAPDGTTTGDKHIPDLGATIGSGSSSTRVYQVITVTQGFTYSFSIFAKAGEYDSLQLAGMTVPSVSATFSLTLGTVVSGTSATITSVGNGWYRCTILFTASSTASIQMRWSAYDSVVTTGDGTSGIYVWGAQVNIGDLQPYYPTQAAAYYGPRFDYNPSTLAAQGLLIEEQRTNLLTYSEAFNTTPDWAAVNITVTPDAIVSPAGTLTGDKLVETNATSTHQLRQSSTVADNTTVTASAFLKAGERSTALLGIATKGGSFRVRLFDLANGTNSQPTDVGYVTVPAGYGMKDVGNGWYYCWVSDSVATGATTTEYFRTFIYNGAPSYTGDNTKGLYIWGAQLEVGAFPTSYIPTTVAQATRQADVASVDTLSPWYNAVEGTLFAEGTVVDYISGTTARVFGYFANTPSPTTDIFSVEARSSTSTRARILTGGVTVNASDTVNVLGVNAKLAGAYGSDGATICVNGGSPVTLASSLPTVNVLALGQNTAGTNGSFANGYLRRITYYPRRLSNAELQAITS